MGHVRCVALVGLRRSIGGTTAAPVIIDETSRTYMPTYLLTSMHASIHACMPGSCPAPCRTCPRAKRRRSSRSWGCASTRSVSVTSRNSNALGRCANCVDTPLILSPFFPTLPWAQAYEPVWVVLPGREAVVNRLRAKAKACSELFLATDEDREGEAISWHLLDLLRPDATRTPVHRVIFHEITPGAVGAGLENPRCVNVEWRGVGSAGVARLAPPPAAAISVANVSFLESDIAQADRPEPGGGAARPAGVGPGGGLHHEPPPMEENRHGCAMRVLHMDG